MLTIIRREMKILEAKAKFVLYVVEGKIVVNQRSKKNVEEQLLSEEFPTWEDLHKNTSEEDGGYDYLLKMPVYSLTTEKIEE